MVFSRFCAFVCVLLSTGFMCHSGDLVGVDPNSVDTEAERLVLLVNEHRSKKGCAALEWHSAAATVAEDHSTDMTTRGYFSHSNPEGLTPFDRLSNAGVYYRRAAENIAAGQSTAAEVFDDWLSSTGHRRNIENCDYSHHGVGLVSNRWTHIFLTPPNQGS